MLVVAEAADDVGVARARFLLGDTIFAELEASPWQATLVSDGFPEGLHPLVVEVKDTIGQGANAGRPIRIDRTPPTVTFLQPAPGSDVTGDVTVAVGVVDASAIARVTVRLDGALLAEWTAAPYATTLAHAGLACGPHTLTAEPRRRSASWASRRSSWS